MIPFKLLLVHNRFRKEDKITWLSWFIRLATFSFWNHIAIAVFIYDKWYVIESIGKGVKMKPYEEWFKYSDRKVKERLPNTALTLEQFHQLLALLDTPYGKRDLVTAYFIALWWRLYEIKLEWKNRYGIICSGLGNITLNREELSGVPGDFDAYRELTDGETYETYKA
jgi:hypothetical protein